MNYKLPTTIVADVILLTSFDAIFTDISTVALRAFHGNYPRFHTLIMQRPIVYGDETETLPGWNDRCSQATHIDSRYG